MTGNKSKFLQKVSKNKRTIGYILIILVLIACIAFLLFAISSLLPNESLVIYGRMLIGGFFSFLLGVLIIAFLMREASTTEKVGMFITAILDALVGMVMFNDDSVYGTLGFGLGLGIGLTAGMITGKWFDSYNWGKSGNKSILTLLGLIKANIKMSEIKINLSKEEEKIKKLIYLLIGGNRIQPYEVEYLFEKDS